MIALILLSAGISFALTAGAKRLLPRLPNWLVIAFTVVIPPTIYVIYTLYQALVDIGKYEAINGAPPPDAVNSFATSLNSAMLQGALWAVLALVISLLVVRVLDGKAKR
jgi:ABC-type Fe3+ transport system permease subunit